MMKTIDDMREYDWWVAGDTPLQEFRIANRSIDEAAGCDFTRVQEIAIPARGKGVANTTLSAFFTPGMDARIASRWENAVVSLKHSGAEFSIRRVTEWSNWFLRKRNTCNPGSCRIGNTARRDDGFVSI